MHNRKLAALAVAVAVTGCATVPPPTYTSAAMYLPLDCGGMTLESHRIARAVQQQQQAIASKEVANGVAVVAGLFLFWPALFFIQSSAAEAAEVQRLTSERDALAEAARRKGCGDIVAELPKATTFETPPHPTLQPGSHPAATVPR